jgi:hypothetical protein
MFFGLPGALARTLDPQTEADPVATIFTFLVLFGCWIGHVPYFSLLADRHYCNEDVLLVGETGEKGRKGHSLGPIEYLLKQ